MSKPKIVDPRLIDILDPGEELVLVCRGYLVKIKKVHNNLYTVTRKLDLSSDKEIEVVGRDEIIRLIQKYNKMGTILRSYVRI